MTTAADKKSIFYRTLSSLEKAAVAHDKLYTVDTELREAQEAVADQLFLCSSGEVQDWTTLRPLVDILVRATKEADRQHQETEDRLRRVGLL